MPRVALAKPGETIQCPCCGKPGQKDARYALRVECRFEYRRQRDAEWKRKKNPPKTEKPMTLIAKKTKTKSFISMDSTARDTAGEQAIIDEHKRAFAAAGGKIRHIPIGVSGMVPTKGIAQLVLSPSKANRKQFKESML